MQEIFGIDAGSGLARRRQSGSSEFKPTHDAATGTAAGDAAAAPPGRGASDEHLSGRSKAVVAAAAVAAAAIAAAAVAAAAVAAVVGAAVPAFAAMCLLMMMLVLLLDIHCIAKSSLGLCLSPSLD